MIGGVDIEIPTRAGRSALDASVRAIRQSWPHARFENSVNGESYDRFSQIPFGQLEELFVYRDEAAKLLWDAEGAVPETANSMIHLIADESAIFVVMDDDTTREMQCILGAIKSFLKDDVVRNAA